MTIHATIIPLEWESEFFQQLSGKLSFSEQAPVLSTLDFQNYRIVQAKIPAQNPSLADDLSLFGFRLVEGEVDLALSIGIQPGDLSSPPFARIATPDDIPALRLAAARAFALSRFRAPWYEADDSGRFYALWAEKAVMGTFDHQCLIVDDDAGHPQGFVTLRDLGAGEARIGLLAVWPDAAGKGTGTKLMSVAKQWCVDRQLRCLRVATQMGNIAALRLYVRCGASIESTAYWLYR